MNKKFEHSKRHNFIFTFIKQAVIKANRREKATEIMRQI